MASLATLSAVEQTCRLYACARPSMWQLNSRGRLSIAHLIAARIHFACNSFDEADSPLSDRFTLRTRAPSANTPSTKTPSADIASTTKYPSNVKEEESGAEQKVVAVGFGLRFSAHGSNSATSLPGYTAGLLESTPNFSANESSRHRSARDFGA